MFDNQMSVGGGPPSEAKGQGTPYPVFEASVECPLFAEEAKLTLDKDGLLIAARFDQFPIPYGEIAAFSLADFRVELQMAEATVTISRTAQPIRWLYDKLYASYNDAVLKALLVEGKHNFDSSGEYMAEENGEIRQGPAILRLYEDCLCLLPPDRHARRIPLCFITAMEKNGYSLTLTLSTGERYSIRKLGRELDNLERLLTDGLRILRERTLAWHKELAPGLGNMQAAVAARLMPLGTAAPLEKLSIVPTLTAALEARIGDSRMARTYPWFRELCSGRGLYVGALPPPQKQVAEQPDEAEKPKPVLWVIAPDQECCLAAVELALADDEAAATYIYRRDGKWESFALLIDRALEATGFQRKALLLPDEELKAPEHLAQAMLVQRTPALAFLRSCFAGRAIHSSSMRWRLDISKYCKAISAKEIPEKKHKGKEQIFADHVERRCTQKASFADSAAHL